MKTEKKEKILTDLLSALAKSPVLSLEKDKNAAFRCVLGYAAGYLKNSEIPYTDAYTFLVGWFEGYFDAELKKDGAAQ